MSHGINNILVTMYRSFVKKPDAATATSKAQHAMKHAQDRMIDGMILLQPT